MPDILFVFVFILSSIFATIYCVNRITDGGGKINLLTLLIPFSLLFILADYISEPLRVTEEVHKVNIINGSAVIVVDNEPKNLNVYHRNFSEGEEVTWLKSDMGRYGNFKILFPASVNTARGRLK